MIVEFFRELLQATAASTVAVLVVVALRKPLRNLLGAEVAYRAWLLVPAAVLAVWMPAPTLAPVTNSTTAGGVAAAVAVVGSASSPTFEIVPFLVLAWLLGAVASLAAFAVRQRRFNARIRRQPEQPFDTIEGVGPAVVGGWRARIVLPVDFRERYTTDEQRLILAHEFQHVLRGDLRAQALATAMRGVFWFNPVVHWGANRFRFDQELACDAAVLAQHPQERRRYAATMLKTQLAQFGLPLACHWQSSHSLKERIAMLKQPLPTGARRIVGGFLMVGLMSIGVYSAWAAQPGEIRSDSPPAGDLPVVSRLTAADRVTPPNYPAQAKADGITGKVWLGLLVGVDGQVKDVHVLSAEPAGIFEQASVDAARGWIIHPEDAVDGQPVERWVKILVQYSPDDAAGTSEHAPREATASSSVSMPSAPPLTMSPAADGLMTRVGNVQVESVPVPGMANQPRPVYPEDALTKRISGDVVLHVLVHGDGSVGEVKVVQSLPAGVFDAAAVAAVRQWSFAGADEHGVRADHWLRVPISFRPD